MFSTNSLDSIEFNSEKLNCYYYKVFFTNSPQYKGISIANLVLGVQLEWTTEYM